MIGPPLPYNVHADMYTVFRNIRPPPSNRAVAEYDARERRTTSRRRKRRRRRHRERNSTHDHTLAESVFIAQSSQIGETMISSGCKIQTGPACCHKSRGFTCNHCETQQQQRHDVRARAWSNSDGSYAGSPTGTSVVVSLALYTRAHILFLRVSFSNSPVAPAYKM